jgi:Protein of unknown function (DUF3108)
MGLMKRLRSILHHRVMLASVMLAVLLHLVILGVIPFSPHAPPLPVLEVELAPAVTLPMPTPSPDQTGRLTQKAVQNPPAALPPDSPLLPAGTGTSDPLASAIATPNPPEPRNEGAQPESAPEPVVTAPARPKTPGESRLAALPTQGEIDYQVALGSLEVAVAKGTLHWKITGDRYHLDLEARTVGIARLLKSNPVTQMSEGRIGPEGLVPDIYRVLGRASETDEAIAQFDWDAHSLTLQPANTVFPMPEGTQDLLSFFFQFSIVPPEAEGTLRWITNGRKLDRYSYELTEKTRLKLPLGEVDTLHVSRLTGLNEDSFDIWLGEKYHLLPVQIRFFARGRSLTLYAKEIRIAAPGPDSN